jgi:hypothetical protein
MASAPPSGASRRICPRNVRVPRDASGNRTCRHPCRFSAPMSRGHESHGTRGRWFSSSSLSLLHFSTMGVYRLSLAPCVAFVCVAIACSGGEFSGDPSSDAAAGSAGASGGSGGTTSTGGRSTGGSGGSGASNDDGSAGGSAGDGSGDGSDGDAQSDASTGGTGADGGCTPRTWYPDADSDGYGRNSGSVVACDAPGEHFAEEGGDCNDDVETVFPGQTLYFAAPFTTSGGSPSFDYNCSGAEEGDPSQAGTAPNCGILSVLACTGQGFVPSNRTGPGVSPICGSPTLRRCEAEGLACNTVDLTIADPKRCR